MSTSQNDDQESSFSPIQKGRRIETVSSDSLIFGLANFSPPVDESEDSISLKIHLHSLACESRCKEPNKRKINLLMNKTFSERRNYILKDQPAIIDVLSKYPVLHDPEEVRTKFVQIHVTDLLCQMESAI